MVVDLVEVVVEQVAQLVLLLPLPASWTAGAAGGALNASSFGFSLARGSSPVLAAAFARYRALTFPHTPAPAALPAEGTAVGLSVVVADLQAPLALHVVSPTTQSSAVARYVCISTD